MTRPRLRLGPAPVVHLAAEPIMYVYGLTLCGLEYMDMGYGISDKASRVTDDPVDCMTCLVVEARP